ncbi:RDD family protein [Helicobacter pametensis]|uniref:RDD family protein n=1 Tax=Helicobacter pametensis TaxID=95149 RepID=UPI0004BC0996|nr:RDD family protein [Helicobacter pametensis]
MGTKKKQGGDKGSPKISCASFFERFKALVIDVFMIYTPILYVMTYGILGSKEAFQANQWAIFACILLYGIIDSLFCCIGGQTPGMRAQELKLYAQTGQRPNFFLTLLRFFIWLLSLALLFGFVFPFLRKDRKTFHDLVCQTEVRS